MSISKSTRNVNEPVGYSTTGPQKPEMCETCATLSTEFEVLNKELSECENDVKYLFDSLAIILVPGIPDCDNENIKCAEVYSGADDSSPAVQYVHSFVKKVHTIRQRISHIQNSMRL